MASQASTQNDDQQLSHYEANENQAKNNKGASLEAIQHHYDLSNQFYSLWLDENMIYSGAKYQTADESLEQAQIRKLDHHLKECRIGKGDSLLDIGCGWGAILKRAIENYDAGSTLGLTLSEAQAQYANKLGLNNTEARVQSWQDHNPETPYDAIISVGAFEHFARIEYSDEQKTEAYADFFKKCQEVFLKPGGYISLQTFAYGSKRLRSDAVNDDSTQFLAKEIFPETDPPHLSNIANAIQGRFEIVSLENDRMGYAHTLREWMKRLKANREKAVATVGEAEVVRFEKYLQYSFIGFQTANLDLYRITLKRLDTPFKKAK